MIEVYTDGSSQKNQSGWGYVIVVDGISVKEDSEIKDSSWTNQQMELTAAIKACEWLEEHFKDEEIVVYSDSAYLVNCYKDKWWENWIRNGWINTKKQPVANKELWSKLISYFMETNFTFEKVKGHSGLEMNERADKLAQGLAQPRN